MSIAIKQPEPLATRPRLEISKPVDNIAGRQYRVSDDLWTHVVTLNNGCIHCSCGLDRYFLVCSHIDAVEAQEAHYREESERRAMQHALFDITNQEMMERIYG